VNVHKNIIKEGVELILTGITGGDDWRTNPEMKDTPDRVMKSYLELTRGYDIPEFKLTAFPTTYKGMLTRGGIPFTSLCAHHMLPYIGTADVGIIYNKKKLGLSKIIRLIQHYSAKLTSQEELTDEIVEVVYKVSEPKGFILVLKAYHLCEACRGVRVPNVSTITASFRGVFEKQATRNEFYEQVRDKI
jgi:GTP cyclohydrolase I